MSTNTADSIVEYPMTDFDILVFGAQYPDIKSYVYRGAIKLTNAFTFIYILANSDAIYVTYRDDISRPKEIVTRQKCVRPGSTGNTDLDTVTQLLDDNLSYSLCDVEIKFINTELPTKLCYYNILSKAYICESDCVFTFAWALTYNNYVYDILASFELRFQTLYLICARSAKDAKDTLSKEIAVLQQENTHLKQQVADITNKISTAIKDLSINLQ